MMKEELRLSASLGAESGSKRGGAREPHEHFYVLVAGASEPLNKRMHKRYVDLHTASSHAVIARLCGVADSEPITHSRVGACFDG